jgi:DNA-binding MarR family transcriptional regulator
MIKKALLMQQGDRFVTALHEWIEEFMHRSMRYFLVYFRDHNISPSQIETLFLIHKGTLRISELGHHMGITSAATSQNVERLVRQGLVIRSEDSEDRRAKMNVLTEKGHQILNESFQARQEWLYTLAETFTSEEKEQIITTLDCLTVHAKRLKQ